VRRARPHQQPAHHRTRGAGKTRLAIQLCKQMAKKGWTNGFLEADQASKAIKGLRDLGDPALVVIDYAETRPELAEPFKDLTEHLDNAPATPELGVQADAGLGDEHTRGCRA